MTEPRPGTRCRRCGCPYGEHGFAVYGLACPDDSGRTFQRHVTRPGASQSFSPSEIALLHTLVTRALKTGGTAPELVALRRKVTAMMRTASERSAQAEAKAS